MPTHPITNRNLTSPIMRARILMTASPACREHNVWFGESLVSASRLLPPPPRPPHWPKIAYPAAEISTNGRKLSKSDLVEIFSRIDTLLAERNTFDEIVIGGGSAMAFLKASRSTEDVDLLSGELGDVSASAADRVADEMGLTGKWLNHDASRYADLSIPEFSSMTVFAGSHLIVLCPDTEHLLAMKLLAARDKDLEDAAWLAKEIGDLDKAALHNMVRRAYMRRPDMQDGVEWSLRFINHVCDEIDLQEQLAKPGSAPATASRM